MNLWDVRAADRGVRRVGVIFCDPEDLRTAVHYRSAECIWFHLAGCSLPQPDTNISASPSSSSFPAAAGMQNAQRLMPVMEGKERSGGNMRKRKSEAVE